jgi:hypothetical protein
MLQETAARLAGMPSGRGAGRGLQRSTPLHGGGADAPAGHGAPSAIVLEPVGRNTAPAIALAAHAALAPSGEGALMLVLPADHVIRNVAAFQAAVEGGAAGG